MRTSTKFYVFGSTTNISSITSMTNFGAAALTNANADVTNKLPAGVGIADVAQFAVSPTAIGIVTTAGNVYMLTKLATLQGDNAGANGAIWHQVKLSDGTALSGVVKFSLSGSGAFALTATGKIYYWGRPANVNGIVNTGTSYNYAYDMSAQIPSGTSVVELVVLGKSTGTNVLFLLCNNLKVYNCGLNDDGVLGANIPSTTFNQPNFQQVNGLSNIVHIDGNTEASLFTMGAMSSTGRIYGWGDGVACMLGIASQSSFTTTYTNTTPVDIFGVDGFMDFSISGHFTIAFFTNPTTAVDQYCYVGHNTGGSIGLPSITAAVISKAAIARLDAPPPISFNCSNSQPTIDITESLTAFSSCIGSASASQMIVVAGTSMTNNLTITAPAGFEISTSAGTGYSSTATLTHTGGNIAATNIYIRIAAGSTGAVAGNLVFSSTGATTQNLAISGTVNNLPVIATVTGAVRTGPGSVTLSGTVTPAAGTTIDWFAASTGGAALGAGVLSYTTGVLNSTTTFFAEARNTSTGCVSTLRVPVIATINGSFSAGAIGANQSICLGATAAAFSSITAASGGTGAISYQWQSSLDNTSFTDIPGATLISYTPIGLTQTTYYKRLAITVADGSIASNTISITVNPLPIVSLPIDNARTGAGPVLLSATASAGATLDWYAASSGGSILAGGNAVTNYTTASISVTTTFYVEARNSTTGCVSLNRIPVVATINGSFAPGSISADQSFCLGLTATPLNSVTDASGGTGSISYQWQVSTTSNATGFTDIPSANAITYAPGILTQTSYFRRVANTVADGNVYSNVVTITINPLPIAATAINGSRTGAGVVNIGAVVAAGETTDWYQVPTAGTILSGGTGTNSFNTPSITSTTNYYAVARNTTTGCVASVRTLVIATIVIPTPVISVSGSLNVFNACIGSVSPEQSFSVSASNLVANLIISAPTGYELSTTTGTGFANSISISPIAGTIASTTIFVRLSNTAVNTVAGNIQLTSTNASSVTIATGIATVSALSNAGTISGANTVCAGLNSATLSLSGNLGTILKWQSATDAGFSTSSDIANTSNTQLASNLLTNTYYRAIVQNGYCAQAISTPVLISVNPTPVITPGIIASISTTATSFSIPFTATNANQYSISVGARALPGFRAISNQALSGTSIVVTIPATAVGSYDFNIIVRNSSTGCIAATVPIVLNIGKQNPTLSLADITKNYNDPIFTIAAVSNSTGAISYSSSNSAVATIVNNQVTIVGAGTSIITATQLADANYNAASTTATMVVNKLNPTISLANISKTFGNPDFTIAASSNSTGAISYSIDNPAIATISGNTVHLLASGSAIITATQIADGNFHAASTTALLIVSDLIPSDLSYPSPNFFTIDATISPLFPTVVGTPTAYSISPALPAGLSIHPTTGIISGKPTVYSATKNYTVTASIAAGAATAIVSITVNKINNTLALANITKSYGDPNFTIAATTNSTGAITYGIANAAVATIAVNNVSIVGAGTSNITASQVEDDKHVAASTTATLTINKIPASLSLADITKNYGDPTFSINAASNSTGAISYSIDNSAVATTTGNTVFIQGAGSAIITVTQAADANHFAASITAILNVNKIAPVLSLSNIIKTYGDPIFVLNATSTGNGAISYSIDNPAIASIAGNQVTINAAGTATITVSQAASANHLAAMVTATLLVNKKATLISLADIIKTFGEPDFTLNAVSDRAGSIAYSIANNSLASISGNAVHLITAGTTTITATQLEDANHLAGTVSANLIINKAATVLSLADIIKTFGDPSFSVNASSNSNGLITYSIADPSIATVSGNQISIVAAGVTDILVNQTAGTNHLAASILVKLTINKMAATLSLGDIVKNYGDPAFNVNALSNSTGVISYTIANTSVATVLGNTINIVFAGTTTIIANLAADANHNALSVTANLIVNKVKPNLLLNDISKSFGDPDFAVNAISNAPGVFSYTIANPAVATVVGNAIQLHSAGVTSITVQQAASLNYLAATDTANLYVNKISPTIQLPDLNKKIGDPDFAINATSNSTGTITYSIDSATIASISGNQVSIKSVGIATITASQVADANYLSGTATAILTVGDVAPSGLSYPGPNVYSVLSAIPALTPTVSGTVNGFMISPALPTGLSINASTGVISGTPSQATAAIVYTVTATNTAGSVSATVSIAVNKLTPIISLSNLSKTMGDPVFGIAATSNSIGTISYSSSNASVATISGNLVSLTGVGVTTITATQAADAHYLAGTVTATLTVGDVAPSGLSYPGPNVYPVLSAIPALTPTVTGTVTGYSISPALPTGLSINALSGVISGTPTQATAAIVYTVTATNTAGSVSATVSIAVNKLTPTISLSNLSKTMGDSTFGIAATSNSTGTISYSSSNASVATIIGNQVSLTGVGVTTLTATQAADAHYLAGTATATLTVVDVAPSGLSYPGPNVYSVLSAIPALTPTVSGTVTGYSISPALPTGLSINALSGVISGTPTQATAAILYTVTASNTAGSISATVSIAVNKLTPTISLSSLTKTMGDPVFGIAATSNSTGTISYSSSNASVATIIGNQVSLTGLGVTTLTATQVADAHYLSGTATATLTVNAAAWVGISYPSPNVYTVNTNISPLVPTIGGTAAAFVISPALPSGLSISATTGIISGTPTQVSVAKDYTVTATINGSNYTAIVNIAVKDVAPTGLSYPSPNVYPVLSAIPALTPTVSGTVTGYSISPALPTGLSINASTGVISGTATQATAAILYTVTASNTAGSISATVSIAINKLTPTISLSNLSKTMGDPAFGIAATSNSTGAISYSSSNASVATINGNQVSLTGVGVTTLTATQAADAHYLAGTVTATLTVGDVAPSGLSYPGPNVYSVLSAIPALTPTVSGTVTGYSISPALPTGLSINASTGVISGTPTQSTAAIVYTITATNTAGSMIATVSIAVNKLVPTISMNNIRKTYGDPDFSIAAISNSPGKINYAINIASIATISGNIVTLKSGGIATITASQEATGIYEAATVKAQLLVNPLPKNGFEYPLMNILTIDKTIQPIKPMIQGVLSGFSISPALPSGLTIDQNTGYIIGTPTVLSKLTEYTVIATDGMLSLQAILNIQVNDIPPVFRYQPDRDIANPRLSINNAIPLSTGGKVVNYTISPALPIGIQLNAQTGLISGKITTLRNGVQEYLVTGTNSGGVATAKYSLVFNSAPTDILLSNYQVLENIPSGSQIGILNVADIDDGDTHNYQLVSGVGAIDNSNFEIRNNVLVSKSSFNYEQKNDYQIRIKVTDEGGLVYEKSFHILIIDVNEVPTLAAMGDIRVYNLTSEQVIGLSNMSTGNDLNQTLEVQLSSNKSNLFESFKVVGNQILFALKPEVFGNDVIIKVLVKDNGGISNGGVDTMVRTFVLGIDPLPKVTASPEQVSLGKTTQLEVEAAHAIEYRWKNSIAMIGSSVVKNPIVRPIQDDQFAVTVKNKWGYTADGSVKVNVVMDYALESNNILTPNGDGHNDRWMVANIELYPDNEVAVYDKAGKLVYREKGYRNQWDGKLNGVPLKDDAYFYIIQFNKPNVKPIKGYLTIIH
jgi:gliding motility-associated-like protein